MLLPNKLFSYNETALSKIPYVLKILNDPLSPSEILHSLDEVVSGPLELIDVLDVLYAPVSYTHLDVYKRQGPLEPKMGTEKQGTEIAITANCSVLTFSVSSAFPCTDRL